MIKRNRRGEWRWFVPIFLGSISNQIIVPSLGYLTNVQNRHTFDTTNQPRQIHYLTTKSSRTRRGDICQVFAEGENRESKRTGGSARFVGVTNVSDTQGVTSILDVALRVLLSDIGSIVVGLVGLGICLVNRVSFTDAITSDEIFARAVGMGQQSRADLLAVFASMALLLNGVTKLDVTSALAETVQLEGTELKDVEWIAYNQNRDNLLLSPSSSKTKKYFEWALEGLITCTPASTAVLMVNSEESRAQSQKNGAISSWLPSAVIGAVPSQPVLRCVLPSNTKTPILDRFLKQSPSDRKESYLPTLQALPGKVEFTYLPPNTQSTLIVPVCIGEPGGKSVLLVLGGDTAKNFTPRDIAWCQVISARLQEICFD